MTDRKASQVFVVDTPPSDGDTIVWDAALRQWKPGAASGGSGLPAGDMFTTMDFANPQGGSDIYTAAMFPADTVTLAWGVLGDTFPRIVFSSTMFQDGINFSDGSYDPWNAPGPAIGIGSGATKHALHITGGESANTGLYIGLADAFFPNDVVQMDGVLRLRVGGQAAGARISSAAGAPTAFPGRVGDVYIRTDPSGANTTLYRCTVEGAAGAATWAGIL